jgi:hypothetical protein
MDEVSRFGESATSMKATDQVIGEQLAATDVNVGTPMELSEVLKTGIVHEAMVNIADVAGAESRLKVGGAIVYSNHKVPRGMAALYDSTQKMIGLYRL